MSDTSPACDLEILLAGPRGFCAGVERAIRIVERALELNGPPVYVRHEIVHNRHVVAELEARGAVFVDELDQVPEGALVIFSAHGVPKRVTEEARRRRLVYTDAACPLVSKVHREVEGHVAAGRTVLLIGHAGHPEVEGTMGQVPEGTVLLVQSLADADRVDVPDPARVAYATQTTLSVVETGEIVARLQQRFPLIKGPRQEDICYATTNRQQAVAAVAAQADLVWVVGAPNSSNSLRLVEVALRAGARRARLLQDANEIDWDELAGVRRLGLTAGASAPEHLVRGVIDRLRERFEVRVRDIRLVEETVAFRLPPVPRLSVSD